ncbi:MAG: dihydrodipicolinate synthase family protein [Vicinamibacterales bacterium]
MNHHSANGEAIAGLFAAVATPVHADGSVDFGTLDRLIDFLLERDVSGLCLGGATGEYPHFESSDRTALVARAARRLPRDRALLVGIGGVSIRHTLALGRAALESGSRALLLPMPMFFRYEQDDLAAFCAHLSSALRAPCLLYNLPDFTNGLNAPTILKLLRQEEFIVGIKDSSGRREHLELFASEKGDAPWTLLVGDDAVLEKGLRAGWNGSISGIAGFCPELLVALYQSYRAGRFDETARLQRLLDELISHVSIFPTPWGIRIGLAARGIETGPLPLPLTAERKQQIRAFTEWLPGWLAANGLDRGVSAPTKIRGA